MITRANICRVLILGALLTAGSWAVAEKMTMNQAVAMAKRSAFEVLSAMQDAKRAAAVVGEANAQVIPKLTLSGSYTRYTDEITAQFNPPDPPTVVRPIDRTVLQLSLNQYIDVSGIAGLAMSGARALLAASDAMVVSAINNAGLRAKAAFLAVGRAEELLAVADERLKNAQSQRDVAQKRYDAGTAPKFDVIRLDSDIASAKQQRIEAMNGLDLARASFNETLARDVSTPVELEFPSDLPQVTKEYDELARAASAARPDILAARKRLEYQTRYRQGRERESLPTLNISGGVSYDPNAQGFGSQKTTTSGTLLLSMPLFDAGVVRARVRQASADEEKARLALEQTEIGVSLQVKQAFLNARSAKEKIEAAEKNEELAREALRLANVRYEAGVGTPVEISDATVQFVRARTALVNAIYDYWEAVANLQRAVGTEEV
jgi:outer membrane protein